MKIAIDKNQTIGTHARSNEMLHRQLVRAGCTLEVIPLPFADYCEITPMMEDTILRRGSKLKKADLVGDIKVAVDRKNSIDEVCGNICGKSHARFRDEVILAQKCGCKLYILVENNLGINEIRDVFKWQNPRRKRYNYIAYQHEHGRMLDTKLPPQPPTNGQTLAKAMLTMQAKYGVEFLFCRPSASGDKIIELLGGTKCEK